MDTPDKDTIAFASLLVSITTFAISQILLFLQRRKRDQRSNVKLRIFRILGGDSLEFKTIAERYREEFRSASESELEKAIYEMLIDQTAYYECTHKYRAHWRNPKQKDKTPVARLGEPKGSA